MCFPWTHRWEMRVSRVVDCITPTGRGSLTRALYVCPGCGKADVREVKGAWTETELQGVEQS